MRRGRKDDETSPYSTKTRGMRRGRKEDETSPYSTKLVSLTDGNVSSLLWRVASATRVEGAESNRSKMARPGL